MRLLSHSGAFSATNPFRTGPESLMIVFLVGIHPLSLFVAMCTKSCEQLWSDCQHYTGEIEFSRNVGIIIECERALFF